MTVTLELAPEREAVLKAQAEACGLTVEQWLIQLTEQVVPPASRAHLQRTDPDAWAREFVAWAEGNGRTTPLLSDECCQTKQLAAKAYISIGYN
ncbi:MAG: hypothetical protein SGI92_21305 [Bryobacteraceae bacterium]|nr:hypothetical protein [Bryobacteraceae bacterium]